MDEKMNIFRSLALLIAGALISILAILIPHDFLDRYKYILIFIIIILAFFGSNLFPIIWKRINFIRRKLTAPKFGILGDMVRYPPKSVNISPIKWKEEIERVMRERNIKIDVKLIDIKKNFDHFSVILNPYGSIYPEHDSKNSETLDKIFLWVREGGLFINVSDIPGYLAYDIVLKRQLDTIPPVYNTISLNGKIVAVRSLPNNLVPFVKNLGLQVVDIDGEKEIWKDVEFDKYFDYIPYKIKDVNVNRVIVVERNIESIIKPRKVTDVSSSTNLPEDTLVTPLFYIPYGEGKFLISLLWLKADYPNNDIMKYVLSEIIVKLIMDKNYKR